ncbi:hypothetical protein NF556_11565 [Ornithinimicrobium faecis]|uniref:Uncharacterized protein n=1 Tax=Ornithinimicrobium faecis TaxID=2934158 RepID=A0ABY4YP03_9MICO|nr:hypothetical protein [Ornithinimicrobium sp. HY1793]USQ78291.1 hypothetical protein NF556_11565 [Ornithinimicrobium sp. HY1793]
MHDEDEWQAVIDARAQEIETDPNPNPYERRRRIAAEFAAWAESHVPNGSTTTTSTDLGDLAHNITEDN